MLNKLNNRKNILLVDDDRSVTQMLSMLLETRGYGVNVVHTGGEAIDTVSQDVDLILLDLVLPDTEGFELCRRLKEDESTAGIPIIILSAKLLSGDIVEGLYLGADDYLTKPFEYEELVARMEAVIRRASLFKNGSLASKGEEAIIREIRHIIDEALIIPFFQPIFLLEPLTVYGFEALCRPQTQSMLASPELLFKAAIQFGFYQELEIASWDKALSYAYEHITKEKIFLNCNPYLVEGARFTSIKDLFAKSNISPQNVILEITERSAISDFEVFYKHLNKYREHGFKFAVDDV
ncbi:MAG: response regulator, partial [Candidatus Omnitrophica bacterium]|nr:response regulator [Candidatus Omnitrophota bacterium]